MFVYLHIPFCASKCIYCDFFVVLEKYGGQAAYVDAVCREIALRWQGRADLSPIQTLYVGGGTPSLLGADDYRRMLDTFRQYADFAPDAELTLEANPQAMRDRPERYREVGFNRLSVGIQSLDNHELKRLSRLHTVEEAEVFVRRMHAAGFDNISIDLMYGIPDQTVESWKKTLARATAMEVAHISMYGLKVEEGTPLERLVSLPKNAYPLPDEEQNVAMYFQALEFLEARGYHRYEFSNLARTGRESRHNVNYWENGPYWAFGASAHGYVDHTRYETVRDLQAYLGNPLSGSSSPCPIHERLENAIIFGLRKRDGIRISAIEAEFGIDFEARYGAIVQRFLSRNLLQKTADRLWMPVSAIPLSNTVLAEFLG